MGRTITPTYRTEIKVAGPYAWTPAAWRCKEQGRPTDAALAAYVAVLEASTREGGCNAHLGETTVRSARIIHQPTGDVVATYRAAAAAA